jgi:hypothetical protein
MGSHCFSRAFCLFYQPGGSRRSIAMTVKPSGIKIHNPFCHLRQYALERPGKVKLSLEFI